MSAEAKGLIDRMLAFEPEKRISAQEALNDAWIQKNSINSPLNTKVLANLGNFAVKSKEFSIKIQITYFLSKAKTKLQAALYTFIATQVMSQAEKTELEKAFKTLDKDGDGRLSVEELIEGKYI